MTVKTKGPTSGDVFLNEYDYHGYTREDVTIDNSLGATDMELDPGYPFVSNTPLLSTDLDGSPPTITGLLVNHTIVPAGETVKASVLSRGPAVINADALPTEDTAGTAFDAEDLVDAITSSITTIIVRYEPTKQLTQST